MPSDFAFKALNRFHGAAIAISRGKIGWTGAKMPVLELTTIGRKSGLPRSVLLTAPWQDGERMALIASAGGNDKNPAWFLNLRANSSVNRTNRRRHQEDERPHHFGGRTKRNLERGRLGVQALRRLRIED